MKYRSRSEIVAMILQAATGGATKTGIMYSAYLSYAQVREYLEFVQAKGLLMQEEETRRYKLTDKGREFLGTFDKISDVMAVSENTSYDPKASQESFSSPRENEP